ncbi:MAG: metal-dependent transcriptional regulator [candidate division WOR-3 bacterium]|nr:metal-dependent transcriptional regulator [candidate division WOR-3 bacterium]MCX7947392.1 metal-dependent transcriptional regulator [candidate division WOR-3 bacterium]MDW8150052.1 metal-dependent transcriptional regulator [candidate division WOR-3 bacterium]
MKEKLKLTPIMEDYLKNIYYEIEEKGKCSIVELSKRMNIKPSSVSEMIDRLVQRSLVRHEKYADIELTELGRKVALEVIRHHRLIELYLLKSLGYDYEKLHQEAENLEHHISKELADAIYEFLGKPRFDPHGHPIPDDKGRLPQRECLLLSEIKEDEEFVILEIPDSNFQLTKFLHDINIIPQKTGKVVEKSEIAGYVKLLIENNEVILGVDVSKLIKVRKL